MKITNKHNLPSAFVNLSEDTRKPVDKQYSTTTILRPTRQIILERRHFDEIEIDVSDSVWLVFGTAVHKILESTDKTGYVEHKLERTITGDYKLTGRVDLYNADTCSVEDYKTATTWKIIYEDFDDWKKQGLIYAWLLRKAGMFADKLKFHALLKDWTAREYRLSEQKGKFYPEHAVWTWIHNITTQDMIDIEKYIIERFNEIIASENLSDEQLPMCTKEERWNTGDKFAVLKQNRATAVKVFDTEKDAKAFIDAQQDKDLLKIELREGEDRRCQDYCIASKFCSHYKNVVSKK